MLLLHENKQLKTLAKNSTRHLEIPPGTALPSIHGVDVNGEKVSFGYGQDRRKTVFLVFSTKCGACKENMPAWQSFLRALDKDSYRVIAVSLKADGVKESIDQYQFNSIPVIAEVDSGDRVSYQLALTPQTIVVDSEGRVEKVWTGVLQGEKIADVEKTVGVRLSGARR
jgi:peroxiredoxin